MDARQTKSELKGVRELLSALIAEGRTDEAIEMAMAMLGKLQEHNSELMLRLAQMRRERSGRRSEKIDPAQLSVMLELCGELAESEAADDSESEDELAATEGAAATPRRRPRRQRRPRELPRDVIRHELSTERRCWPPTWCRPTAAG